mmetsp:Transcript_10725/g.15483  ORF Transcript_10725/g.15483 Transcript_10725/m.15483 type:complete len:193 (-) Transcript_10725:146-724(-)
MNFEPEEPNIDEYDLEDDPCGINKARYIEDVKDHRKEMNKLKKDCPELYGLITQYLSEESLDEIKRQEKYEEIDEAADSEGLWKLVEETHKVTTVSKVEAVTKLSARNTYKTIRQGNYDNLLTSGALQQPANLNAMYLLANQWLNPPKATQPGWQQRLRRHSIFKSHRRQIKRRVNEAERSKRSKKENEERC